MMISLRSTFVAVGTALVLGVPAAAFAYDEDDAIRDCNNRLRDEYKLSDFRHESAEQLQDSDKHFIVTGKSKVDGEQYGYKCEIKDRHVTSVNYDGPEPEGMSTSEKLAVGAAAAIAAGAAAAALSKKGEAASEPAETVAPPEVRTNADGSMAVMVPGGCTVLYNDIGLRESVGSGCSEADLKSAEKAMTAHLK
jgi:hypothetical protein